MKASYPILLLASFALHLSAFGQENSASENISSAPPEITPLVILLSEDDTIEFDPAKGDTLNYSSIKPEWISSVDVIDGLNAKEEFGDKGLNGVVIIHLKDQQFISRESLVKLKQSR